MGIEYLWEAVKTQAQNRHEVALSLIHWMLVGNGFRCIGRDSEFPPATSSSSRVGTERLPENWNDRSAGFYSLLYVNSRQPSNMYLIRLIPGGSIKDAVILGQILVFSAADDIIPFELDSRKYVPEDWNMIDSPVNFPEFKAFADFVDKEIIAKILRGRTEQSGVSGGREGAPSNSTPFFGQSQPPPSRHIPFVPDAGPPLREFIPPGHSSPFGLGSRDLDPFSGIGGNIMGPGNFMRPGFPGTNPTRPYRYDPIVPPDFGPRGGIGGPFGGPSSGFNPGVPGTGNRVGGGGIGIPGVGPGGLPRVAPRLPGEPDPDHERPLTNSGDDLENMFM